MPYSIPILEKSYAVINCISENKEGLTLSEIVKKLDEPKSTIFKILFTLEKQLIIEKKNSKYFLGSMLIHYGLQTLSRRDLKGVVQPFLNSLMKETGETAHLTIPVGMQSMILDVVLTTHPIKFSSPVGSLFPLYCTSHGKIYLTFGDHFTFDEYLSATNIIARTEQTITEVDNLKVEIEKIYKQGFSVDELEFADDIRCCAAPIFDSQSKCIGTIGITSTSITFTVDRIEEVSAAVKSTAFKVSSEMGYMSDNHF